MAEDDQAPDVWGGEPADAGAYWTPAKVTTLRNGRMVTHAIDLVGPQPRLLGTRAVISLNLGRPVPAIWKVKDLGFKANDLDPLERTACDRLLGELTR
jgi:hypothetical protein